MANKLEEESQEEDIVYSLTAGFYPQLASAISFKSKPSVKGGKGVTYAQVKGFDNSSIMRMAIPAKEKRLFGKKDPKKEWKDNAYKVGIQNESGSWLRHAAGSKFQRMTKKDRLQNEAAMLGYSDDEDQPITAAFTPKAMTGDKGTRKRTTMAKYLGGNEIYKMWGTKVWYQHGHRPDKNLLIEAVKNWNGSSDYLNTMYKSIEPKLAAQATKMAKAIFATAFDEMETKKGLQDVIEDPQDVAEETHEAMPKSWKYEKFEKQIDARSKAKKMDQQRTLKDGSKEYIDVTEMSITQPEQHGISEVPKVLTEALAEIEGDEASKGQKAILKAEVIKLIISNIDRDNKVITSLKKFAGITAGKKGTNIFEKIMDATEKAAKAEGNDKKKFSVADIANAGGFKVIGPELAKDKRTVITSSQKMAKATGGDAMSKASLGYVIHTLANMGDGQRNKFRQGMRLTQPKHGRSLYASIPMQLGVIEPNVGLFLKGPPQRTQIIGGFSHTLALREKEHNLSHGRAAARNRNIHQSFANARILGLNENSQVNSYRESSITASEKVHHSTSITLSPKGLTKLMQRAATKIQYKTPSNAKEVLDKAIYRWGGKGSMIVNDNTGEEEWDGDRFDERGKKTGNWRRKIKNDNKGRFWALPYVGIMDNQHHEKNKKQGK